MKKCIIASLLIAALLMSVFPTAVLADSPDEPWKPDKPFGAYQEPYEDKLEDPEQGINTPYGHESAPSDQGVFEEEDFAARPYYIGRVEDFYPTD